jgi:hypothetical protein
MLKNAEELVGVLYIKPHTAFSHQEYDLTPVASALGRAVGTRVLAGSVEIGKIAVYCLSRDPGGGPGSAHSRR